MSLRFPSAIPGVAPINQGKTRDLFPAKAKNGPLAERELMLIVATDRLSTHNIVHESTIPKKGEVLTALTIYWLTKFFSTVGIRHHLVAYGKNIYDYLDGDPGDYPPDLYRRSIVVQKLKVLPIEFIFRARLGGSLFEKFYSKGIPNPYGVDLPPGLQLMSEFPRTIFTPTEKSETDDPLKADEVKNQYSSAFVLARAAFSVTRNHLRSRGYEQIDGKFEVALDLNGHPVMVDEIATPDSSRFCVGNAITLGSEPPYLDKQIARDEAVRTWGKGSKFPLFFSPSIIDRLSETYLQIFAGITGHNLSQYQSYLFD